MIARFECLEVIIVDNVMCFKSKEFNSFCKQYGIQISYSSPYHPQGNGQVESSNKNFIIFLKRVLDRNKKAWDSKLQLALWDDRVTVKRAIGCAPFDLVYGIHARLPQNNLLHIYKFIQLYDDDLDNEMKIRLEDLIKLDESRRESLDKNIKSQLQYKNLYDKRTTVRIFNIDDVVLMWNVRLEDKGKHKKLHPIWLGPYLVNTKWQSDSYILKYLVGNILEFPVHGQFLKLYFS